jgi:hypothetical protein
MGVSQATRAAFLRSCMRMTPIKQLAKPAGHINSTQFSVLVPVDIHSSFDVSVVQQL